MTNPVKINGVEYPSQSAVARAFGVSTSHVFRLLEQGKIETVGTAITNNKPVTVRGVEYPSYRQAARDLNVTQSVISQAVKNNWLKGVGLNHTKPVPVTLYGVEYRSLRAASIATGHSIRTVKKKCKI